MERKLTDHTLKALKSAGHGKRYDKMDTEARGLAIRVNDKGRKSFVLIARYPGSKNPTRRAIGEYPTMSLDKARTEARKWHGLLKDGKDPQNEIERQKLAEARRQQNSFGSVAEAYFADINRRNLRRAAETEREIRREFSSLWKRPITDIDWADIKTIIDSAIKRGAFWQAHHIFSYAQRLFGWSREQGTYGLTSTPTDGRRPSKIIGPKQPRSRILTDDELRALWHISEKLAYPLGPFVRMLILTGQRKSEVGNACRSEIKTDKRLWEIPIERIKTKSAHVLPLTDDLLALIESLPQFKKGDFIFSTTFGAKPINGFAKAKAQIDALMKKELGRPVAPWVFHDLRRTMRTHLSALPVPDLVRELVIGHTKPGLHKVYDQHAYLDEKRHALELWAARLRSIVEPPPANVVTLATARA